jgi:prepilin-type N-terminal cleavage/methylation domain-containing protein
MPANRRAKRLPAAFTLLELLVVIGIIVLLAAILVPVVSQVRMKGYVATTQGQLERISAAINSYYHDWKAYPGPLANSQLVGWPNAANNKIPLDTTVNPAPPTIDATMITSSENLVLGLLGILSAPDPATPGQAKYSGLPPKHDVLNLNPLRPASYHYIDFTPDELSLPSGFAYAARYGSLMDNPSGKSLNVDAKALQPTQASDPIGVNGQLIGLDTAVPEFMDRIPEYMPILYVRANVGVAVQGGTGIASVAVTPTSPVQYDASQLKSYGFNTVSFDPSGKTGDYVMPSGITVSGSDAQWIAYFMNPNLAGQPRGKDGYVLISAGADRLYGTKDDIIVTP